MNAEHTVHLDVDLIAWSPKEGWAVQLAGGQALRLPRAVMRHVVDLALASTRDAATALTIDITFDIRATEDLK